MDKMYKNRFEIAFVVSDMVSKPAIMSTFRNQDHSWYDTYKKRELQWNRDSRRLQKLKLQGPKKKSEYEALYKKLKAKMAEPGANPRISLSLPPFPPMSEAACLADIFGFEVESPHFDNGLSPLGRYVRLTILTDRLNEGKEIEPINNGIWHQNESFAKDFWSDLQNNWDLNEDIRYKINSDLQIVQNELGFLKGDSKPTDKMSLPLSLKKWASIFDCSINVVREWKNDPKSPYHFEKIGGRKWRLPLKELPAEYLEKYKNPPT